MLYIDTFYAARACRVFQKPMNIDFFAAYKAVTILAGFNTAKGSLNSPELTLTPPDRFLNQKPFLHSAPSGNPA
jgi:hypothetical protein